MLPTEIWKHLVCFHNPFLCIQVKSLEERGVSDPFAMQLIDQLLTVHPNKRPSSSAILTSEFLSSPKTDDLVSLLLAHLSVVGKVAQDSGDDDESESAEAILERFRRLKCQNTIMTTNRKPK